MKRFRKMPTADLWRLIAFATAELASRELEAPYLQGVHVRRINGGLPEATITVAAENRPRTGPMLLVSNTNLNKDRVHHWEAFRASADIVKRVNRMAYRENSNGIVS